MSEELEKKTDIEDKLKSEPVTTDAADNKTAGTAAAADKPEKTESSDRKAAKSEDVKKKEEEAKRRRRTIRALVETIRTLINVAAIAVLIAVLLLPVLRIYGNSMTPTMVEGDLVVSIKGANFDRGDIVAFYYNNKVLVKRVIGFPGEWIDIAEDGTVSINGEVQTEPYVQEQALGTCDIDLPYQIPEDRIFVMGDKRAVSIDSRSSAIGCVAKEQIVGKIVFRIWPLNKFGRPE
ncbi:MAG: signal peptidase I [Eubacteriales bacterium]|nr:signal peptidase I [Eubacteriales bacterium]